MSKRNPAQNPAQSPGSSWHARVLTSPATTRPSFIPLGQQHVQQRPALLPVGAATPRCWGLGLDHQNAVCALYSQRHTAPEPPVQQGVRLRAAFWAADSASLGRVAAGQASGQGQHQSGSFCSAAPPASGGSHRREDAAGLVGGGGSQPRQRPSVAPRGRRSARLQRGRDPLGGPQQPWRDQQQ